MSRSQTTPVTLENQASRKPVTAPEVEPPGARAAPAVPALSPANGSASPAGLAHTLNRAIGSQLSRAASLLQLQRAYGNRYVQRVVALARGQPLAIQPKLVVGPAGDNYEQEADRVADRVLRMPEPATHASSPAAEMGVETQVQRKSPAETILPIQRQSGARGEAGFQVEPEIEQQIAQQSGGGQPLPEGVRRDLEPRFGADFSGVRVHMDAQAHQLNESVQAQAFTTGQNIFFRRGAYAPGSESGQRVLAHELTHVIQQTGAGQGTADAQRSVITPPSTGRVIQRQVRIISEESEETPKKILKAYNKATESTSGITRTGTMEDVAKMTRQGSVVNLAQQLSKMKLPSQSALKNALSKGVLKSDLSKSKVPSQSVLTSALSQKSIDLDDELEDEEPKPDSRTPWLKVSDLYMGVTQTGPESWPELVEHLFEEDGTDKFTVFTGTHGNLGGQFLDKDGKIDKKLYQEEHHTEQDRTKAEKLKLKGYDIKVIDIFEDYNGMLSYPNLLNRAVKDEIKKGQVVILAWCFSMEAFKSVRPDIPQPNDMDNINPNSPYGKYLQERNEMRIKNIVEEIRKL